MKLLVIILAILTTILTAVCETVTFGTKVMSTIATIFTDFVIAWATWEIMKFNKKQTEIAEQKRKDDLLKIRLDTYDEIIEFLRLLSNHLSNNDENMNNYVSSAENCEQMVPHRYEQHPRLTIPSVLNSKKLFAQMEYVFDVSLVKYIKNKIEEGGYSELGDIEIDTNNFKMSKELESLFEPFFSFKK